MIDVVAERIDEHLDWLDAETHAAAVALYDEYNGYYRRGLMSFPEWQQWVAGHEAALTDGLGRYESGKREIITWHIYRDALFFFGAIDAEDWEHPHWRKLS